MQDSPYLKVALDAIEKAERIIMEYFSDDLRATLKPDQSPVTIADKEAEQSIVETIRSAFPDHGFLGEELGEDHSNAEYVWVIDPIDGTKNYLRTIPFFATQLALMHRGELILGVSNAPALHERLWAEKGKGAFCNGAAVHVSNVTTFKDAFLVFGGLGYFERTNSVPSLLKLASATRGHRGFGDFWGYHLVAQGKADIMVEAKIRIWDIAALTIIVREAGGMVTDMTGQPITVATTSALAANTALHPVTLEHFPQFTPLAS